MQLYIEYKLCRTKTARFRPPLSASPAAIRRRLRSISHGLTPLSKRAFPAALAALKELNRRFHGGGVASVPHHSCGTCSAPRSADLRSLAAVHRAALVPPSASESIQLIPCCLPSGPEHPECVHRSLRRRHTRDLGFFSCGRHEPGLGPGPLPLRCPRSLKSRRGTASPIFARRNATPWSSETLSSVTSTLPQPKAGVNDTRLRQTEVIETVRATSPTTRIIVSGLLPTYRRGHKRLFRADGLHPSRIRADLLSYIQDASHHMTKSTSASVWIQPLKKTSDDQHL
ncbi:uncharacterized protein LOC125277608 [Megalobrama amblycephala]|uniref:uncharacterized protein LOC125277608 n=1 Tax=Megalobrama amblycephala TaxID=75352 RepID=UPI0020141B12|nr:uncharacterized protein LOC125277608 [Megalobrama amblycephala]